MRLLRKYKSMFLFPRKKYICHIESSSPLAGQTGSGACANARAFRCVITFRASEKKSLSVKIWRLRRQAKTWPSVPSLLCVPKCPIFGKNLIFDPHVSPQWHVGRLMPLWSPWVPLRWVQKDPLVNSSALLVWPKGEMNNYIIHAHGCPPFHSRFHQPDRTKMTTITMNSQCVGGM